VPFQVQVSLRLPLFPVPPKSTTCPVAASYAVAEALRAEGLLDGLCCTHVGVKLAVCANRVVVRNVAGRRNVDRYDATRPRRMQLS
jgi:hypothetical protein